MRGLRVFFSRLSERIRIFLPTLLPSLREEETSMANSSMAFIAIAIPVLVVTVAVTFFNRYGSAQRYQENFNLAQSSAQEAVNQTDPADVRVSWERTIYYLDQAEQYKTTQQSEELRQEAQAALDGMDDIVRLDFAPTIIGGLPRGVQVSHMAATETDLYLLDSAHADIIRTYLTSQGYEIDTTFACASGAYGGTTVGPLVDMAILPKVNKYSATVLAMDASGNMLYCGPSETPVAASLAAPSLGLHAIAAFAIDSDGENLYILDPQGNSVWSYSGSYSAFTDLPIEYFADQVPQDMGDAIDMTINSSDLYLLFRDGHVTNCTESSVAPTACNDPVTFIDDRPEHHSGPQISDAVFGQMTFAAPPDQMLYLFEPNTQAVYQFVPGSNSLTLQDQFRASEDLDQTIADQNATAMAISPTRTLFMSVGSQVYSATLP